MTKEQSANMLDKGMIHFQGWGKWNQKAGRRSHYATQSGAQFKIYELFISEIFPLNIFILQLTAGHQNCGKWNLGRGDWLYALAFWFIFLPRPPLQQLLTGLQTESCLWQLSASGSQKWFNNSHTSLIWEFARNSNPPAPGLSTQKS